MPVHGTLCAALLRDPHTTLTGLTYKLGTSTVGTLTYAYTSVSRRSAVGGTWVRTGLLAALTSATYNGANQILTSGGTNYTYDNNGSLTNDGTKTYTWNVRNQLTGLSGGGISASLQYDGLSRRRAKTVSGTTTGFRYGGVNPLQELSGGSPSAYVLPGLTIDEWFSRTTNASARHFLTDALGSTAALGDGSGTLQTQFTYEQTLPIG